MEKIRKLLGKRKPLEERKPLKKVCIHRIRMKLCKIGAVLLVVSFILGILSMFEARLIPLFVFSLIDYVVTIIPAFYVEDLEIES